MVERTVVVGSTSGLHARPAKLLVNAAKEQPAAVRLRVGDRPAIDTRSILAVLTARVKQGTEVTLEAEGDGAEAAVAALADLIARNLDEEGDEDE
ncbi:HPr family phosphocarrier protein [Catenulispora sp. NF23]|uniref:HPr family phosphocarrier protein n=1 Tax=Catenulispora pinistramenti TaxID=2705254 RepID=A0ABS5KTH1_9ACTN|nr:HPr family phosphocarrier protein [Catenulispora pinistramenti]MBS2537362.1 HPr family phosphocarrier protein [Catenulispora pinistramenti]MBS2549358.1 HPr family phosphocarrier protein [Catenulispora pinistramenti]